MTAFSSAFVLGWQSSRLPTDYVSMAKVSCRARGHAPVRGISARSVRRPRPLRGDCPQKLHERSHTATSRRRLASSVEAARLSRKSPCAAGSSRTAQSRRLLVQAMSRALLMLQLEIKVATALRC